MHSFPEQSQQTHWREEWNKKIMGESKDKVGMGRRNDMELLAGNARRCDLKSLS